MRKNITVIRLPRRPRAAAVLLPLLFLLALGLAPGRGPLQPALAPALFGTELVIDAGHGGSDPGMVGRDVLEKDVNLEVARKLAEYCRGAGAGVALTREDDRELAGSKREDLAARAALAEEQGAAVFISLHCNSFVSDPRQRGAQVFYAAGNDGGQRLAACLQQSLSRELGNTERSALPHADSYLLRQISGPAVIVELGFLSNTEEEELLADPTYQWQLAWALFRGLAEYITGGGAG